MVTGVEHDLHRHPLDDLDPVAGGILGRQQREAGTGAGADRVHHAAEPLAREAVDFDLRLHAGPHARQLRLLEVGEHPHFVQRHDGQQRLSDLHDLAHFHRALRHDAVRGSPDLGVGELELGERDVGLGLLESSLGPRDLGLLDGHLVQLALRAGQGAAALGHLLARHLDGMAAGGQLSLHLLLFALSLRQPPA
jgi:hypothetical protein